MNSKVTELDVEIAARIKALRKQNVVTMALIARFLDMTYQSYQDLENGKTSFRVSVVRKLATFYNVNVERIIGFEGEIPVVPNMHSLQYVAGIMTQLSSEDSKRVLRFAHSILQETRGGA